MPKNLIPSEKVNALLLWSVQIELQLAHTFARLALQSTRDAEKKERNSLNARRAYDTVKLWLPRTDPTEEQQEQMRTSMIELRNQLSLLGQKL